MWWLGLALLTLSAGCLQGWVTIRRGRRPLSAGKATFSWLERPVSIWREDWAGALFIFLHCLSIVILAILFLLDAQRITAYTLPFFELVWRSAALGFVCWSTGIILAFPIARRWAPPFTMQLFSDTVARGQYVTDWRGFCYFQLDATTRTIRLYSAYTPSVIRAIWRPPTQKLFLAVVDLLARSLPSNAPPTAAPWYRRRTMLFGILLICIVPAVVGGVVVYYQFQSWSWIYYSLAVLWIACSGIAIIQKFQIE